jgi:hypothetical protein
VPELLRVPLRLLSAVWSRPWLGFAVVFAWALWQRWQMPWLPLATADSWGFLAPALHELAGEGFRQTHGRSLAYPLFLLSVLRVTESFPAIAMVQHALGLLSGVAWIWVFSLWVAWLPASLRSRPYVWWCGAFAMGLYLLGAWTVIHETLLRPESIFPLFAFLQVGCILDFVRLRWGRPSGGRMVISSALAFLFASICISLKPSWGFAAVVPAVVLVCAVAARGAASVRLASFVALACGLISVGLWQKGVPQAAGWIADSAAKAFLPATLFTVHADLISQTMHEDAARGLLGTEENAFLAHLDQRLAESRMIRPRRFKMLGHDPDYLMYHSDALTALPGDADATADRSAEYLLSAYFSAIRGQPIGTLRKIAHQVFRAHRNAEISLHCASSPWRTHFERACEFTKFHRPPDLPVQLATGWRDLFDECNALALAEPQQRNFLPPLPVWFIRGFLSVLTGLLVVAGVCVFPLGPKLLFSRANLLPAARVFAIFVFTHLGMVFTVALVHSFDIVRYLSLLSPTQSLLVGTGSVLLVALASAPRTPRAVYEIS